MEILGLIPARSGSKGIPGKNVKPLGGMPLIDYTFRAAREARCLTRIVLSTDGADIAALAEASGIDVPFMRPAEIAGDEAPAASYVAHCLDFLADRRDYRPEIVVILQPTAPFRTGQDIDHCVENLRRAGADSAVSVCLLPAKYHPRWQFEVGADGLLAPYGGAAWSATPARRQANEPTYTRNGAVYAFWTRTFRETGTIYGNRVMPYVMPPERSSNIDDAEDWRAAETLLRVAQGSNAG